MDTETNFVVIEHDALTGEAIERPATTDEIEQRQQDLATHKQP